MRRGASLYTVPPAGILLADGDSITEEPVSWTPYCVDELQRRGCSLTYYNSGVSGQRTQNGIDDAATQIDTRILTGRERILRSYAVPTLVVLAFGTNDFHADHDTGAFVAGRYAVYVAARRAAYGTHGRIVCQPPLYQPSDLTEWNALWTILHAASWPGIYGDALVDYYAIGHDTAGAEYSDGLHPTEAFSETIGRQWTAPACIAALST